MKKVEERYTPLKNMKKQFENETKRVFWKTKNFHTDLELKNLKPRMKMIYEKHPSHEIYEENMIPNLKKKYQKYFTNILPLNSLEAHRRINNKVL